MGRSMEPLSYIDVIMARLSSNGISPVFSEALYSSWRGWARLLLHCSRSNAGISSRSPEEFSEIVLIASMMFSLMILMPESVFDYSRLTLSLHAPILKMKGASLECYGTPK